MKKNYGIFSYQETKTFYYVLGSFLSITLTKSTLKRKKERFLEPHFVIVCISEARYPALSSPQSIL